MLYWRFSAEDLIVNPRILNVICERFILREKKLESEVYICN